MHTRSHYSKIE